MVYGFVGLLVIAITALGWMLIDQQRRFRAGLAEAELRRLRTQLTPHFLFNTLNAISELGYDDPAAADQAITRLSGLLRKSLDEAHGQEISLAAEIDFLEDYLALQHLLLREALDVAISIDPAARHARVPSMILQPLVENALIHGQNREHGSRIQVSAVRAERRLVIEISDNGPGLATKPQASARRPGIGIANARARLAQLYGDAAGLALHDGANGGAMARITLPFRELP